MQFTPFEEQDIVSQLFVRPNIPKMLELSLENKMRLFTKFRFFLNAQRKTDYYSVEDRFYLREIKQALIKDLSELPD